MNIFVLDRDPVVAAKMHCDKHVVKMILEYGQLLSTAHRLLDGKEAVFNFQNPIYETEELLDGSFVDKIVGHKSKSKKFWVLPGEQASVKPVMIIDMDDPSASMRVVNKIHVENKKCYSASHMNHPCGAWARENDSNYNWLLMLMRECLNEYTFRYGKLHSAEEVYSFLKNKPKNIRSGELTPFAIAMPEHYKVEDEVQSYQNYYMGDKVRFAKWTNSPVPTWFSERLPTEYDLSTFQRTRTLD